MNERRIEAIAIGTSAGGVDALSKILPRLPKGYPFAVFVVIHVPPNKNSLMAGIFGSKCQMNVKEAEDKEPICSGTIYFAPPDYHLLIEEDRHLALSNEEPVHYSRPAIDVSFESASDVFGDRLIGVVLTGGNEDGAAGLRAVEENGGIAIVQAPRSAYAMQMPQAALDACPGAREMTLDEIANFLAEAVVSL